MAENRTEKLKFIVPVVLMAAVTTLLCIVFLYLAFRKKCLGTITVFHVTSELFSVVICQILAFSLSKVVARNQLRTLMDTSRKFRVFRNFCLILVFLMAVDAVVWMRFGYLAEGTRYWMTVWYLIPMSVLALIYAGIFRWMTVQGRKLENSFHRLMSDNVAAEIRKEDGLEGKTSCVTVLFCQTLFREEEALGEKAAEADAAEAGTAKTDAAEYDVADPGSGMNRLLRLFYSEASEICEKHGGTALEFPGFCVLCVFGAPEPLADHEASAVRAALEIVAEMNALENLREQTGFPSFSVGIGINTGNAHVGNVGSEQQKRFSVIGSSVNLASRIGCYAKPGEILISENVRKAVADSIEAEEVAKVMPKGFDEPVSIFRVKQDGGLR